MLFSFEIASNLNLRLCGYNSKEDTPVPIPNTEVKPLIGNDTARVAAWESRTMP